MSIANRLLLGQRPWIDERLSDAEIPCKVEDVTVIDEFEQILISFESSPPEEDVLNWLYDAFLNQLIVEDIRSIEDVAPSEMEDWKRAMRTKMVAAALHCEKWSQMDDE